MDKLEIITGTLIRIFVALFFIGVLYLNLLSVGIGSPYLRDVLFHNKTMDSATELYHYRMMPPNITFRIWELVYSTNLTWLVVGIFLWFSTCFSLSLINYMMFFLTCLFNIAFLITFNNGFVLLGNASLLLLTGNLWIIAFYVTLQRDSWRFFDYFTAFSVTLYASWTLFTYLLNIPMCINMFWGISVNREISIFYFHSILLTFHYLIPELFQLCNKKFVYATFVSYVVNLWCLCSLMYTLLNLDVGEWNIACLMATIIIHLHIVVILFVIKMVYFFKQFSRRQLSFVFVEDSAKKNEVILQHKDISFIENYNI